MTVIFPERRELPIVPCPVCEERVTGVDFTAGWVQRTIGGTRTGTYPPGPPADTGPDGRPAVTEPFPSLDEYHAVPCGDRLGKDQAIGVQRALSAVTLPPPSDATDPHPVIEWSYEQPEWRKGDRVRFVDEHEHVHDLCIVEATQNDDGAWSIRTEPEEKP